MATALMNTVHDLKPGDHVKVTIEHHGTACGVLRQGSTSLLDNTPRRWVNMLVLDIAEGFIVRDPDGAPGSRVKAVEVVTDWMSREEQFWDRAADLALEWLEARATEGVVPKSELERAREQVQLTYEAFKGHFPGFVGWSE
jgi:hypothetical protein